MPTGAQKTVRDNTICALITTLDEEREIAECIESLLWCDEILVVDSFSTDRTPQIVASFPGVRFEQRTYYGSAAQKNWAMDLCHQIVSPDAAKEPFPPIVQSTRHAP